MNWSLPSLKKRPVAQHLPGCVGREREGEGGCAVQDLADRHRAAGDVLQYEVGWAGPPKKSPVPITCFSPPERWRRSCTPPFRSRRCPPRSGPEVSDQQETGVGLGQADVVAGADDLPGWIETGDDGVGRLAVDQLADVQRAVGVRIEKLRPARGQEVAVGFDGPPGVQGGGEEASPRRLATSPIAMPPLVFWIRKLSTPSELKLLAFGWVASV